MSERIVYDGRFAGLLTAIFDIYTFKYKDPHFYKEYIQETMFEDISHHIVTDTTKSQRVWSGLKKKLTTAAMQKLYFVFLSEQRQVERLIYDYVKYAFDSSISIEGDFTKECVSNVEKLAKKVSRERHRFKAFVRLEDIGNGIMYAPVSPDYNILPLIAPFFKKRYAAQNWIIYDTKRKYGLYYDKNTEHINEVVIDFYSIKDKNVLSGFVFDPEEHKYQELWKQYFKSTNIPARKNTKLHLKHVPRRYWKYLVEKQ